MRLAKDPNAKVSPILGTDFNGWLVIYLEVLLEYASDSANNKQKEKVHFLIDAITSINQTPVVFNDRSPTTHVAVRGNNHTLETIYSTCKGIFPAQGADKSDRINFDNFIGLCLFLSVASNSKNKDAVYHASQPPFKKLLFT